jgi:hypothetical protein
MTESDHPSDGPGTETADAPVPPKADQLLPALATTPERRLTAAEFQGLAEVPPEFEWFANIKNPSTKRHEVTERAFL